VLSAAAGAFALELLFTLLTSLGVPSTWRDTVQGLIIIAAVAVSARAWQVGRRPRRTPSTAAGPTDLSETSPTNQPTSGETTGEN
jgi:ribose transport system permease protein